MVIPWSYDRGCVILHWHRCPDTGNMKSGGDWHNFLWNGYNDVGDSDICCHINKFDCELASYHYW